MVNFACALEFSAFELNIQRRWDVPRSSRGNSGRSNADMQRGRNDGLVTIRCILIDSVQTLYKVMRLIQKAVWVSTLEPRWTELNEVEPS